MTDPKATTTTTTQHNTTRVTNPQVNVSTSTAPIIKNPQDKIHSELDATLIKAETELEDTNLRYLGYGARIRTALLAAQRYLAYTSDFGEAFRPVVHSFFVRASYGISWAYVLGDVAVETLREKERKSPDDVVLRTATKRALFQSMASMIFPMFTIHQTVHLTAVLMKRFGRGNKWIPTIAGLAMIPALPYLFDHPVEHTLDSIYDTYWPVKGVHPGHSTHHLLKEGVTVGAELPKNELKQ